MEMFAYVTRAVATALIALAVLALVIGTYQDKQELARDQLLIVQLSF